MDAQTNPFTPTAPSLKPVRLAQVRLTRAHHVLQQRAAFVSACSEALQNIASRLHAHLGQPVEARARLTGAAVDASQLRERCAWALFEMADAQTYGCLELDLPFLCGVLDALAAGGSKVHAATALTRVEEAAFGFLALQAVAALRQDETVRCRLGPGLAQVTLDRKAALERLGAEPLLGVELTLTVGDLDGRARFVVPSRSLEAALMTLPVQRQAPVAEAARLQLDAVVMGGRTRLDAETIAALGRGDVVVLDGLDSDGELLRGEVQLQTATFTLVGTLDGDGFHHQRAQARTTHEEQFPMPHSETIEPSDLPVDLEVELCRTQLPVVELSSLKPGGLLPLKASPSEPVLLKVGNRVIARAELVDIDGQLGARILELLGKQP